jgi:hypothetical protein
MSRQWARRSEWRVGRAVVAPLVLSIITVSGPAVAGQSAWEQAPSTSTAVFTTMLRLASPATEAPHRLLGEALERSIAMEGRRLAQAGQVSSSPVEHSARRCGVGLGLLAVGGTVAALSIARHSNNAQAPAPPVWSVIGSGVALAGGVEAIRQCGH